MNTTQELQNAFRNGWPHQRTHATWLLLRNLDEYLPWLTTREFKGINLMHREDGWLLVLKAQKGRKAEVAFVGGDSPEECYVVCAHQLLFGLTKWKEDKSLAMRSDKR